jgi:hypothetical protein
LSLAPSGSSVVSNQNEAGNLLVKHL